MTKSAKQTEQYRKNTERDRLELWKRYQTRLSEGMADEEALSKALQALFPKDSNRARKLKTWEKRGLWPPPEREEEAPLDKATTTSDEVTQKAAFDLDNRIYGFFEERFRNFLSSHEYYEMVRSVLADLLGEEAPEDAEHEATITPDVQRLLRTALGQPVTEVVRAAAKEEIASTLQTTIRPYLAEVVQSTVQAEVKKGDHIAAVIGAINHKKIPFDVDTLAKVMKLPYVEHMIKDAVSYELSCQIRSNDLSEPIGQIVAEELRRKDYLPVEQTKAIIINEVEQQLFQRLRSNEEIGTALSDTFRPQVLEMVQSGMKQELTAGDYIRPHVEATITEKALVTLDDVTEAVERAIEQSLKHTETPTIAAVDRETVRDTVREEIGNLFGDIRIKEIKKPGKGHKRKTIKKSVTMPIEIYEEVDEYCKDNDALISNVITAALRMFLKSRDLLEKEATTSASGGGATS